MLQTTDYTSPRKDNAGAKSRISPGPSRLSSRIAMFDKNASSGNTPFSPPPFCPRRKLRSAFSPVTPETKSVSFQGKPPYISNLSVVCEKQKSEDTAPVVNNKKKSPPVVPELSSDDDDPPSSSPKPEEQPTEGNETPPEENETPPPVEKELSAVPEENVVDIPPVKKDEPSKEQVPVDTASNNHCSGHSLNNHCSTHSLKCSSHSLKDCSGHSAVYVSDEVKRLNAEKHKARETMKKRREAARLQRMRREAIKIQAFVRGAAARKVFCAMVKRKQSIVKIQSLFRGAIQRLKYKLIGLEKKLETSEVEHKQRLKAIKAETKEKGRRFINETRQELRLQAMEGNEEDKLECVKMIKFMRKQNQKIRNQNTKYVQEMKRLRYENYQLGKMIEATEESTQQLLAHQVKLHQTRDKVTPIETAAKKALKDYKHALEETKEWCLSEMKVKTLYENCIFDMVEQVQERSNSESDLAEELLGAAMACEPLARGKRASLCMNSPPASPAAPPKRRNRYDSDSDSDSDSDDDF